jgi:Protein of unknown function (DUF2846)
MRLGTQLLFGLSLLAMTAVLSAAREQTTKPATASVYFYRCKQFAGNALSPSVYCDDVQLARVENGRFFVAHIEPGKHTFYSNDKQSGLEIDLNPGERYLVRVEIGGGVMRGTADFC